MRRALLQLFHRPALQLAVLEDARGICRNPHFASFLVASNRKALDTVFHDSFLRGRRFLGRALTACLIGGGAWIVLESARALTVF
ncbi:MAG: hypothetical protein JWM88_2831 [Verrucomicrobia bacterium]|nr:hypothetical protein [Verrucomicrobiota bacterium]